MNPEEAVSAFQQLVEDTTRFAREFAQGHGGGPLRDSPAAVEGHDPTYGRHARQAFQLAAMQLEVAQDSLRALAIVLAEGPSVFAIPVLARAALETSARAAWLLETDIDPHARTGRVLSEQLYSLVEKRRGLDTLKPLVTDDEPGRKAGMRDELRRTARLEQELITAGVSLGIGKKKDILRVRKSATALTRDALGAAGVKLGVGAYGLLSGTTHGTISALVTHMRKGPEQADGTFLANVSMTLGHLHFCVATPLSAWRTAFGRRVLQMGWGEAEWRAWEAHIITTLAKTFPQDELP